MFHLIRPTGKCSRRNRASLALKLLFALLSVALLLVPAACITRTDADVAQEVAQLIASIDPENSETLSVPEKIIQLGRPAAPALLDLVDSDNIIERWAAVYYFSRMAEPEDIESLSVVLNDANMSLRTVAAATLLRLGDDRGLTILQDALASEEVMLFSKPPVLLSDYADWVLAELGPPQAAALLYRPTYVKFVLDEPLFPLLPADIDVQLDGCIVNVVLNLQFSGAGATQALADGWATAITNMWNGRTTSKCCKLKVTVNVKVGGEVDPDYAQITVVSIPAGALHTSNATLGETRFADNLVGEWDTNDTGFVVAHEAGHLMGIKDDYYHDAAGNFHKTDEAISEAAVGLPDIMAQTWPENGNPPVTKTRHGNQVLKAYGITCPDECIEECLPKTAPPTTTPPPSLPPVTTTPPPTTTTPPPTTTTPPPTTTTPTPTTTPPPTTTTPPPTTTTPPPTTTTPPPTTTTPPTPPPTDLVAAGFLKIPIALSAESVGPPCTSTVVVSYSATISGDLDINITNVKATIPGKAEEDSGSISTTYYHNTFSTAAACGETVTLTVTVTLSNGDVYTGSGSITTPVPE